MSEQVCTCGHPQSEHGSLPHEEVHRDSRRVTTWFTCHCGCNYFRAALPWPTSPGCWWVGGQTPDDDGNMVPAKYLVPCLAHQLLNRIVIVWDGKIYGREDWEDLNGPARFVKLFEENPFDGS